MKRRIFSQPLAATGLLMTISSVVAANFTPIPLSNSSLTHDVVVERSATPPPPALTSASMDEGQANTAYGWYEIGFNADALDTGLPVKGSTVSSEALPDHSFTFAASYTNNNAVLIDSSLSNATVTVTTPAAFSALSFLTSAGNGAVTLGVAVHHADGSVETNSIVSPDWFGGENAAVTANGRLDVGSRAFDNVASGNPRLYSADITLTNTTSPVNRIDLTHVSGTGHAAIFAVSGGTGAAFSPVAITGYNVDLVVEAEGAAPATPLNATTATLDAGVANTGYTIYEQGYNPNALTTGLPVAGSTLTNASATDHIYTLAASYATNNAALVDAENNATLTPSTPAAFAGLSFLTAAGGGAVTIDYTVTHADGSTQGGSLVSPDWFNSTPVALTNRGRVNVENGGFDSINSANPRLYGVDVSVTNSTSPISSIALNYASGTGHAVFLAVSGTGGAIAPIIDVQPVSVSSAANGTVNLGVSASGAAPLQFQWQREVNGTFVNLTNASGFAGVTTTNLTISSLTAAQAGSYRVQITNAGGTTTSDAVQVNVLSTATDITSPADVVTSFGGNSPAAEMVANAIDNTTAKYLNFGTDTNETAPFVGPVGLIVTPVAGSTVVTGLRVYTANDAPERDPSGYVLEGSNDGTNFTAISSGALALPTARNASGSDLDPLAQNLQEVQFTNTAGYTSYRLSFNNVRDNTAANSMQIAEIELLGTTGTGTPSASLTITRGANGALTLTATQPGTLQSTATLGVTNTTWQDEGPINGSVTVTPTGATRFYRVVPQP